MKSTSLPDAWASYNQTHVLVHKTVVQYEIAVGHWVAFFGDRAIESVEKTDMAAFTRHLVEKGQSAATANKTQRHCRAILRFALDTPPEWKSLREPRKAPLAFTIEEFQAGLSLAREWPGWICGVPAGAWWESLLLAIWYSGGRIGAMLQVRWDDLLFEKSGFYLRAEYQKQVADQFFVVGEDCLGALRKIQEPPRDPVWPWPYRPETLYRRFRKIFTLAGVKLGHSTGALFHRIRKSTASYLKANGGDATGQLGHSTAAVTARYFDPRIVGAHDSTRFMPTLHTA